MNVRALRMDGVRVVELIETTLTRRGDGTPANPVRIVRQFWTKDGELVAELDPCCACHKATCASGGAS